MFQRRKGLKIIVEYRFIGIQKLAVFEKQSIMDGEENMGERIEFDERKI